MFFEGKVGRKGLGLPTTDHPCSIWERNKKLLKGKPNVRQGKIDFIM